MVNKNFVNINFMGQNILIRRSAGSHIPVLKSIAKNMRIKRVFEIGMGIFSTKTFLNKDFFPDLEELFSYENSNLWIKYMNSILNDKRWKVKSIKDENEMAKDIVLQGFADLIFVDGLHKHRLFALNHFKNLSDIFVLHDCELDQFKGVLENGFKYKFVYVPPEYRHTAILSQKIDVSNIAWNIEWDRSFTKWI
jgi:hypothetical protein